MQICCHIHLYWYVKVVNVCIIGLHMYVWKCDVHCDAWLIAKNQFALSVELGGRVVSVLDSGQPHQSERSWVRFPDGLLKKNCQASGLPTPVTWSRGQRVTRKNTID